MPSLVTPAKRSRDSESDHDDSDLRILQASSSAAKRQRLALRRSKPTDSGNTLMTASSKHQPGAIIRVKLKNFVTYKDAEFYPGPSLNMVIGPNGNGKSTLVCAICLGLGWGSQHLGRAKDVGDFVKHGASEATIEIELQKDGKKYTSNPVIKALIRKDGNKMSFTLDGRQSSRKVCQDVARSFSIQIDNLCQFLPQDRVVEFAALSPVELLKSTQRAIASEEMIQWHGELITLGKDLKNVEQTTEAETDNLKVLEARQRTQEADVQRLRERDGIKRNIQRLETVRPLVQFTTIRNELTEAKERHKAALDELQELTAREAPSLRAVNEKEEYRNTVKLARESLDKKRTAAERIASSKHDNILSCDRQLKLIEQNADGRKKRLREAKAEIKRLDGIITTHQKELEGGEPQFDLAAVQEQIRELARHRNSIKDEVDTMRSAQTEANTQMVAKDTQAKELEIQIENLDSQTGKQEQKMKHVNPDAWKAWEWVQKHQDQFQKPILGPPIIECSVNHPDVKYADMLEALIQQGEMFTFTAQTPADQREFHRLAKDVYGWKKTNTRCAPDASRFKSPMNDIQMRSSGFEGWAKDYIQGPAAIVAMLCEAANLHRVGICPTEQSKDQFTAAEQSLVSGWVTPKSNYRIMRRAEYGAGATSTTVRDIRKASYWTDQPIDSRIKDEMQANVDALRQDIVVLRRTFDESNIKCDTLATKYAEFQKREKELQKEKETNMAAQRRFLGLEVRIRTNEERREESQQTAADILREGADEIDETDRIYIERANAALSYVDLVLTFQKAIADTEEAEIMFIEAESDAKVLIEQNRGVKRMLESKTQEVNELAREKQNKRTLGLQLQRVIQKIRDDADEEFSDFLSIFTVDKSLERHDQEIEDEKQRLELTHDGNAGAIKQFTDREKVIEKLKKKLEAMNIAVGELTTKVQETRNNWEPRLDALAKQISSSFAHNMGQINCNGSVEIFKHEDYDQWAIEIFVRFREGETMTRLDAHRQSGGERAVSTIFYLMSLQTLTRSPFRVVDEINQGMDPRNERLVHSRMVAIATGNDDWQPTVDDTLDQIIRQVDVDRADLGTGTGSQYFLVTPKLLHDLRYEEGMTVMCINSGEHLASGEDMSTKSISFTRSLEAHRALRRQAITAT